MNPEPTQLVLECFNPECRRPSLWTMQVSDKEAKQLHKEYGLEKRNEQGGVEWMVEFQVNRTLDDYLELQPKKGKLRCPRCDSGEHLRVTNF